MNIIDVVFMFVCTLLVWLMSPGVALFYGGMVQSKNVLNTVMHSIISIAIVTITWSIIGFSLSFGSGNMFIGDLSFFFLNNVNFEVESSIIGNLPIALYMLFQLTFCILSVSILTGSIAERIKFFPFILFVVLWTLLVYSPVAHWVWGGGWIHQIGALDFAGGTVVHISSGVSGLILALLLGSRKPENKKPPHNLIVTIIGGIFIWLGWFGFNTGSAFTFDHIAMVSFVNSMLASSSGIIGWILIEYIYKRQVSVVGTFSGMISGLVGITPAAGFVDNMSAILIGLLTGGICYYSINYLKLKLKYDDALDAFGIHGIGGIIGAILTGVFQNKQVNETIPNGLIWSGDIKPVLIQIVAVLATIIYSSVITFVIAKSINYFIVLRTDEKEELQGLDSIVHGEKAYH